MKNKIILTLFLLFLFSSNLFSLDTKQYALNEFKGLKGYSFKVPYTKAIDGLYLGYDDNGNKVAGIAFRQFKSYEVITAAVLINLEDGKFVLKKAFVLDIEKIKKDDQKNKVLGAINDFNGKIVKEASAEIKKVDAVTGATRYHKQIYDTLNLLSFAIVTEMEKNSTWEKNNL